MSTHCKYPQIEVQLTGRPRDGGVAIYLVRLALKRSRVSPEEIEEFTRQARASQSLYDCLYVCGQWVTTK